MCSAAFITIFVQYTSGPKNAWHAPKLLGFLRAALEGKANYPGSSFDALAERFAYIVFMGFLASSPPCPHSEV